MLRAKTYSLTFPMPCQVSAALQQRLAMASQLKKRSQWIILQTRLSSGPWPRRSV